MTDDPRDVTLEEQLVAFLDGEGSSAERARVAARLRDDPAARARLQMLRSADGALREAFGQGRRQRPGLGHGAWIAAAAVVVVAALLAWPGRGDDDDDDVDERSAAANDYVSLRAAPQGGGSAPLFSDVQFDLFWQSKQAGLTVVVLPDTGDLDLARRAAAFAADGAPGELPVLLRTTVYTPGGRRLDVHTTDAATVRVPDRGQQAVRVLDLQTDDDREAGAYLGGRLGAVDGAGLVEAYNAMLPAGRLLPAEPGAWRFVFRVEPLPTAGLPRRTAPWPQFDEPLEVETSIVLTGRVSAWSEAVDGLSARLVVAEGELSAGSTPIALQLRNTSGRQRSYNLCGATQVEIPQPMHFELVVDGVDWQQRDKLKVMVSAAVLDQKHPDGAVRTLLVMPDYWRSPGGQALGELVGGHDLQLRFHHQSLVWNAADTELWHGNVLSPALPFEVVAPR